MPALPTLAAHFTQVIDGKKMYIVGRQLDLNKPLHGGNVEYRGGYIEDLAAAENLVAELNSEEMA